MEESIRKNAEQATEDQNSVISKNGRGKAKHSGGFLKAIYTFQTSFADGITADNLFDSRTEKIIGCQADRLVRTGLFFQHERDDIQQTLRLALLHEMSNFASGGDRYTFAANVVCNYGKNLIAKRAREREATNGAVLSLDEPMPGGETFGELLEDDGEITPYENAVRKESVRHLFSRLEKVDREICAGLMNGESLYDIARKIKMSRMGVTYRIQNFIRPVAAECGLGNFNE